MKIQTVVVAVASLMWLICPAEGDTTLSFEVDEKACHVVADTYLHQAEPDVAHGQEAFAYSDGCGSPRLDGLLGFFGIIGNGPGQIPPGSVIVEATLTVSIPNSGSNVVGLHRVLRPWSEMDTWNSFVDGITPDDCEAASKPDASISAGAFGQQTIDVTSSLAAWSAGNSNYGWVLPGCTGDGSPNGMGINSSEDPNPALRPRLEVTFRPPCPADIAPVGGDTMVGVPDLLALINSWGACP